MAHGGTGRELFGGVFSRSEAAVAVSDREFVQAMIDMEVALLRALARAGQAPAQAADELARACDAATLDLAALGRSTGEHGTPVPGLLSELRARCSEATAAHLHTGATSQDVIDTAMMLVSRRALNLILGDLGRAADACAQLARGQRETLLPGRTLLQHALPLSFGLKAATWCSALDGVRTELSEVRERALAVQLGGAVGTLARLGDHGLEVAADVARELGLAEPDLPWHTVRLRPVRLATGLGSALGMMGKIAHDLVLLAQSEVAEVAEGGAGRGGSSTMPHKRNPVGAVAVIACAVRAPGLVATMLAAMVQEHERAAGAWQAEWETLLELLRLAGSAAAALSDALEGLEVDGEKMRADLELTGGLLMSESVAAALSESLGLPAAQRVVEAAARQAVAQARAFRDVLLEQPEVSNGLGTTGLDAALDPARYLGVTSTLIDRALDAHGRIAAR